MWEFLCWISRNLRFNLYPIKNSINYIDISIFGCLKQNGLHLEKDTNIIQCLTWIKKFLEKVVTIKKQSIRQSSWLWSAFLVILKCVWISYQNWSDFFKKGLPFLFFAFSTRHPLLQKYRFLLHLTCLAWANVLGCIEDKMIKNPIGMPSQQILRPKKWFLVLFRTQLLSYEWFKYLQNIIDFNLFI